MKVSIVKLLVKMGLCSPLLKVTLSPGNNNCQQHDKKLDISLSFMPSFIKLLEMHLFISWIKCCVALTSGIEKKKKKKSCLKSAYFQNI